MHKTLQHFQRSKCPLLPMPVGAHALDIPWKFTLPDFSRNNFPRHFLRIVCLPKNFPQTHPRMGTFPRHFATFFSSNSSRNIPSSQFEITISANWASEPIGCLLMHHCLIESVNRGRLVTSVTLPLCHDVTLVNGMHHCQGRIRDFGMGGTG